MVKQHLACTTVILLAQVFGVICINECCPDENIWNSAGCNGTKTINLTCSESEQTILIDNPEIVSFKILNDGKMIDTHNHKGVKYCWAKLSGSYSAGFRPEKEGKKVYACCIEIEEDWEQQWERKVLPILLFISAGFIILTIIVYAMVPSLLDLQGICIIHSLVGYASAFIIISLLNIVFLTDSQCEALALMAYFSHMYLFFWLCVISFHIWKEAVNPNLWRGIKWGVVYHVFAIGGAVLALVTVLSAHFSPSEFWEDIRPGFGVERCWFISSKVTWIYHYGPIAVLLLCNTFFYIWTVVHLWKQGETQSNTRIVKYRLKMCSKFFIIMGITWIFELITFSLKTPEMSLAKRIVIFIMDLNNILVGFFTFLILVVFRKRVRRTLASGNICNIRFPGSWRYLKDEEIEEDEQRINNTSIEFKK